MAASANLIGRGMSPALASAIGFNAAVTKAGVGTAQTGATALNQNLNVLTTAGGATAFVLPAAISGSGPIVVFNSSSTTALVFPPSGGTIQGGSTDASFSVAQNKTCEFIKISATGWCALLSA